MVHDLAHPGLTNAYLVASGHKQAIRYNDASPLENMHVSKAYKIMNNPESNFLEHLPADIKKSIRLVMIEMILATDNAMHGKHFGELQHKLDNLPSSFNFALQSNVIFFLQIALHSADISNPAKPMRVYMSWTDRIVEEFYKQGDTELAHGLPGIQYILFFYAHKININRIIECY